MSRRSAGRAAKVSGDDFESWAKRHHREAQRLGIVSGEVEHNEPHGKLIHGKWVMVRPGVADFTGTLFDGHGSTLAVECKARKGRVYRSEIEPRQAAHLDAVLRAGGLALLLVRLVEEDDLAEYVSEYAVPWAKVRWRRVRSAESVGPEELGEKWTVPPGASCYLAPFCPVRGEPVEVPVRRFPRE